MLRSAAGVPAASSRTNWSGGGGEGGAGGDQPGGRGGAVDETVAAAVPTEAEDEGCRRRVAVRRRPADEALGSAFLGYHDELERRILASGCFCSVDSMKWQCSNGLCSLV